MKGDVIEVELASPGYFSRERKSARLEQLWGFAKWCFAPRWVIPKMLAITAFGYTLTLWGFAKW